MVEHNAKGYSSFKMGVNQFSDLTLKEIFTFNGGSGDTKFNVSKMKPVKFHNFETNQAIKIPDEFDWRDEKIVSRVGDQGFCGSCYAFSALHSIESQLRIHKNLNVELSTQEILDCAVEHGTMNCQGGYSEGVWSYINYMGGISLEKDYPYTGVVGQCKRALNYFNVFIEGEYSFVDGNEEDLKAALFLHGPIAILFDHLHHSFFQYASGIYYEPDCIEINEFSHGALLIGYGSENGVDYWTVKNSFGRKWGEEGFFKIARNKDNHCLVGKYVMIPILK